MKPVLLLLSIGGVSSIISNDLFYPYDYNDQTASKMGTTLEDILARAPLQAIGAYSDIVQDFSQSLDNLKTAIEEWAYTYGLEQEYRRFVNESEREDADFKTAVKELYPILTDFLGDYMKLENNKKRSLMHAFNKTSALPDRYDRQKSIVEGIIKSYLPSLASSNADNYGSYAGSSTNYPGNSGNYNRGTGGFGRRDYLLNTNPYAEYGGYGGSYTGYQGAGARYIDYSEDQNNGGFLPRTNEANSNPWRFLSV